jgi:hypothetical protein
MHMELGQRGISIRILSSERRPIDSLQRLTQDQARSIMRVRGIDESVIQEALTELATGSDVEVQLP